MSTASRADRRVVLAGVPDAAAAARALAEIFGIEERLAQGIAGAAPIVLVEKLTEERARAVDGALAPLRQAGASIEVRGGEAAGLAKVGWPGAIRIGGRAVEELAVEEFTFTCPTCGEAFVIRRRAAELPDVPKIAREVKPTLRDSGLEEVPLPDDMQALSTEPAPLPATPAPAPAPPPAAPEPLTPEPLPSTPAKFGGAVPASIASPSASGPMALEDFEAGLAAFDDDDPLAKLDRELPSAPPPAPAPAAAPADEGPVALGDLQGDGITVLPDEGPPARAKEKPIKPMSPQQAARAAKKGAVARKTSSRKRAAASSAAAPAARGGGGKCSVYTSGTGSAKVHQLMAEIMGISEDEAADLAQRSLVPIAKDVSEDEAEVIRQRFVAKKVSVRIMRKNK